MYADELDDVGRYAPVPRWPDAQNADDRDRGADLMLRIAMSSMPLAGLVLGVVALALWNAG